MNAPEWRSGGDSRLHSLITQPSVWLHSFRLFFLPIGLTADTDWQPFARWYDVRAFAGYAFVVLLAIWMRRASRGAETRPVAFGLAWFAIALLPASSIFPLAEVANEHRVFFAYIGLVLAIVCWIRALLHSSLFTLHSSIPALVVLMAFAIGTHVRNEAWATEETLWRGGGAESPANGRGWVKYRLPPKEQGQDPLGKKPLHRAAALAPQPPVPRRQPWPRRHAPRRLSDRGARLPRRTEAQSPFRGRLEQPRHVAGQPWLPRRGAPRLSECALAPPRRSAREETPRALGRQFTVSMKFTL